MGLADLLSDDREENQEDINKLILKSIEKFFTDDNLLHKSEIPAKEFHLLLKVKTYADTIKPYSLDAYKFLIHYLDDYLKMIISKDRKSRVEFFDSLKSLKTEFENPIEDVKHRFLRR